MLHVGENDVSNSVCEYEENSLTNNTVITEIQNFNANMLHWLY